MARAANDFGTHTRWRPAGCCGVEGWPFVSLRKRKQTRPVLFLYYKNISSFNKNIEKAEYSFLVTIHL